MKRLLFAFALAAAAAQAAEKLTLVWPTSGTAWAEGKPPAQWLQHAGSGDPDSGGFGGVRGGGRDFHEGLDIRPAARDARGEPLDEVRAAMAGVVRHVVSAPGASSYGRYVVVEHAALEPAVYTLYAHLARLAPGVRVGAPVAAGQALGVMGHSSGGYMIPAERSHLHFEIGLAVTRNFQAWYDRRKFGARNEHGMWNGMNLVGVDPLAFFNEWRGGRVARPVDFFARMETAARVRVATLRTPDFVTRYPALVAKPPAPGLTAGWEIRFNWTGLPFAWTPLAAADVAGWPADQPRVVEANAALIKRQRSKSVAVQRRGGWAPGKDLERVLEQLFGPH
ncbi:MAG: M23 family metallopeptidase [Opitutaceae bacterium]|nr:M23 family metallopeptidase [Opitutaceae bacterium]